MAVPADHLSKVVPAQLAFLGIYNPSLGTTDDTFRDQVVFYYSKAAKGRAKGNGKQAEADHDRQLREDENEKLRQIGLAQGMVDFARSFSNGEAVDHVETEKARIVMHELESGWWILASIDLTRLPANVPPSAKGTTASTPSIEYSSREVSPPTLLLQHLKRAHSVFLLHHGTSLDEIYVKMDRAKFCNILDKFWTKFANNWDVMLHGSPAVDVFGGLKLAAGGELGMGVGEEEWGSGEREVLEDYAGRTEGLVDLMVSRFGEPSAVQQLDPRTATGSKKLVDMTPESEPWMGSGRYTGASDGVVFSGVGAVSRASLKDISHWVEWIYAHGEYTYGVKDSPNSDRRKRRRKVTKTAAKSQTPETSRDQEAPTASTPKRPAASKNDSYRPGIPPPIVVAAESSLAKASSSIDAQNTESSAPEPVKASLGDSETWVKYLTLGYGTTWGGKRPQASRQASQQYGDSETDDAHSHMGDTSMRHIDPDPDVDHAEERRKSQIYQENTGYFIVGLKGDMDNEDEDEDEDEEPSWNNRIPIRTLQVELNKDVSAEFPIDASDPLTPASYRTQLIETPPTLNPKHTRLRVIVYVHRPFIYTFLFENRTESLTLAAFYRNLHTYFSPLHRPLSNSTAPTRVAARIDDASSPYTTIASNTPNTSPIFDLVYDPRTLTVHSSLPNIPEPGSLSAEGLTGNWSRIDALNVHSQILSTVSTTRRSTTEIERTCKTGRGWWVVWMRLPPSHAQDAVRLKERQTSLKPSKTDTEQTEFDACDLREAFLVRRARDGWRRGLALMRGSMWRGCLV
ncbi:hypothetical protein BU16DRAFT_132114 [Lophium mytilinum]|uniref:CCZ1/INTU/HSP4 first Longin domain-containing protein n=1 Tax=Lophium mytilinum TaxID=390894 RepID=A0A6A6QGE0_9PEZI|nr:hypothetical protein BU16DRAFT_132114 [Lophium mytilinum]